MRAVVFVLVAVATVHAQPAPETANAKPTQRERVSQALQTIAQLEQQLEYEQALLLADRTIAEGISTRDQLADLHLIAGRLAAGLDHADVAQQHFAKLLALRPDTALVAGTSPKLQAPFDAARAAPHQLEANVHVAGGKVSLEVTADPLHLINGVRVAYAGPSGASSERVEHALVVVTPAGAQVSRVTAVDEAGNELVTVEVPVAAAPSVEVHRRSRAWIPWAAASGATLVAGGLCAWRYGVAQDEWNRENDGLHDYTRLHALEDRGQRWALAADIGFGLAAATAITAAIVFATGDSVERTGVAFTGTGAAYVARF